VTDKLTFEDAVYELEQTTAMLGFIQTAIEKDDSSVDNDEAAAAIYMLYIQQNNLIKKLKTVLENN